jgi:S-adenosylmethionine:diacylglycerol 3-amino-3-carboxypropyl transferase
LFFEFDIDILDFDFFQFKLNFFSFAQARHLTTNDDSFFRFFAASAKRRSRLADGAGGMLAQQIGL